MNTKPLYILVQGAIAAQNYGAKLESLIVENTK